MITVSNLEKKVLGKDVLIDTNIVIYLTDTVSPYDVLSRRLFEMVELYATIDKVQLFLSQLIQMYFFHLSTQMLLHISALLLQFLHLIH